MCNLFSLEHYLFSIILQFTLVVLNYTVLPNAFTGTACESC